MKFDAIIEGSIKRETRVMTKEFSRRTKELAKQIAEYEAALDKLTKRKETLEKYRETLVSPKDYKHKAKLTGELAALNIRIKNIENRKNDARRRLEKYELEAGGKRPIEPEEPPEKIEPAQATDIAKLIDKMKQELSVELKNYIDKRIATGPPEKAKKEPLPEKPKPIPIHKSAAYKEVEKNFLKGAEAPFRAGPLHDKVEQALNQAYTEEPTASYEQLLARVDELVPEFTIQ